MKKEIRAYSVLGNIAIVNFPDSFNSKDKKKFAEKILKDNKSIKTVLEKTGFFKGRLRKMQTKHVLGEKTKEVLYKESNCCFRFNLDETYFSPRLSGERKEIASLIKSNQEVLVMFAGVAPFSIVIAKNSLAKKVYSNEINQKANKYARLNLELNKLQNKIELVSGDASKLPNKLNKKFDVIVMPRPQLKDSFLDTAFKFSKKGAVIYYYDFCLDTEIDKIIEKIKKQAKDSKKKIKILNSKRAGGYLSPGKIRLRVDFQVV